MNSLYLWQHVTIYVGFVADIDMLIPQGMGMPFPDSNTCVERGGDYLYLSGFSSLYDTIHGWMMGQTDGWVMCVVERGGGYLYLPGFSSLYDTIHGWMTGQTNGWVMCVVERGGGYLYLPGFSSLYDTIHGWMMGQTDGWVT
jgi:hypothetical protein